MRSRTGRLVCRTLFLGTEAARAGCFARICHLGDVRRSWYRHDAVMADIDMNLANLDVSEMVESVLPTGTVTFLLTDIEGSTKLWEAGADETAASVARHYDLLESAIVLHGGVRPVEQGEGDSVVGAFARASDAVAAALDVQRAFAQEPWPEGGEVRVRMALHTGEIRLRDAGNYFGRSGTRHNARAARCRSHPRLSVGAP